MAGDPFETPRFQPQICVSGEPGDPNCPVNRVPIDTPDVSIEMAFIVRLLATGLMFDHIQIAGGDTGAHVEHPQFLIEGVGGGDPYADVVFDIAPGGTATLAASTAIIEDTTGRLSIRFVAVGPLSR